MEDVAPIELLSQWPVGGLMLELSMEPHTSYFYSFTRRNLVEFSREIY
jgi:hypothetical protein